MNKENPMLMAETLQGEMQGDEVMSEEDLQGVISAEIYDAISFIDDDIGGNRALATEYYYGQLFGDEEDGRSQVVSMDVRDTVQGILPSLMRIFLVQSVWLSLPHRDQRMFNLLNKLQTMWTSFSNVITKVLRFCTPHLKMLWYAR
jgi:hypothetical protein